MEDATYHQRMSARTADKIKLLRSHWDVKGKDCADIGAGRGDITKALIDDGARTVQSVELSRGYEFYHPNVNVHHGDIAEMRFHNIHITLCLSVMHHVIGHHGWDVAMETWKRILAASDEIYFEIGMSYEQGNFYWKTEMLKHDMIYDRLAEQKIFLVRDGWDYKHIGALPIHGIERPIYYLRRL